MYVSQIGLLVLQDIHSSKITDLFQNLQKKKKKTLGKKNHCILTLYFAGLI